MAGTAAKGDVAGVDIDGEGEDGEGEDGVVDGAGVVGVGVADGLDGGVVVGARVGCVLLGDGEGDLEGVAVGLPGGEVDDAEGCAGPADDVGTGGPPPAPGDRPPEPGVGVAFGVDRPRTLEEVPTTCGLPWLPGVALSVPRGDEGVELRGAEAAVLRKNPGCTKPSNSSTTSNPDPAPTAARKGVSMAPMPAGAPLASALAWDHAGSGIVRKSSMTCSFSSAPARIASNSGAHRATRSSRR